MILGFMQNFPWGGPTNFRERILSIEGNILAGWPQKMHTFRADPHNRWKAGRKIEMVYRGAGYKILDHFNKNIPELQMCVSTQKIKIEWIHIYDVWVQSISVDGKVLGEDQKLLLMRNDGFDDHFKFRKWFKKDWEGKIIHWTDLRY